MVIKKGREQKSFESVVRKLGKRGLKKKLKGEPNIEVQGGQKRSKQQKRKDDKKGVNSGTTHQQKKKKTAKRGKKKEAQGPYMLGTTCIIKWWCTLQ